MAGLRAMSASRTLALAQIAAQHRIDQARSRVPRRSPSRFAPPHRPPAYSGVRLHLRVRYSATDSSARTKKSKDLTGGDRRRAENRLVPVVAANGAIAQGAHRRARAGAGAAIQGILQCRIEGHALAQNSRHRVSGERTRAAAGFVGFSWTVAGIVRAGEPPVAWMNLREPEAALRPASCRRRIAQRTAAAGHVDDHRCEEASTVPGGGGWRATSYLGEPRTLGIPDTKLRAIEPRLRDRPGIEGANAPA